MNFLFASPIISTKSNKSNLLGRADIQVYIRRQKERGVKINAIFSKGSVGMHF